MESKKIRKISILSAVGFTIMAIIQPFSIVSYIVTILLTVPNFTLNSQIISNIISGTFLFCAYVIFSVLLFKGKKSLGFTVAAGLLLLRDIFCLIIFHRMVSVFNFLMTAVLFLLTLFDQVPALQAKKGIMKTLWIFPPIFCFLSQILDSMLMIKNMLTSAQELMPDKTEKILAVSFTAIPLVIFLIIYVLTICFLSYRFYAVNVQPNEELAENGVMNSFQNQFGQGTDTAYSQQNLQSE